MGKPPIRGYELRCDGHGVTVRPGDIRHFLSELPPAIGMTIVNGPYVSEAHGQGIVIIAESHVFFQVQGSDAVCVVFSCKPFSALVVRAMLRDRFGGRWVQGYEVQRSVPPAQRSWWRRLLRGLASWCCGPA